MRVTNEIKNYIFSRIDARAEAKKTALLKKRQELHDAKDAETDHLNTQFTEYMAERVSEAISEWFEGHPCNRTVRMRIPYSNPDHLFTKDTPVSHMKSKLMSNHPWEINYRKVDDEDLVDINRQIDELDEKIAEVKEEFLFKLLASKDADAITKAINEIYF